MQSSFENLFMLLVVDHPDLSQAQASSVCATIQQQLIQLLLEYHLLYQWALCLANSIKSAMLGEQKQVHDLGDKGGFG